MTEKIDALEAVGTGEDNPDPFHVTLLPAAQFSRSTPHSWEEPAARLFTPNGGVISSPAPVQVLGGPGTGKTSLLVDLACAHCATPGVNSDSVLVLTQSKRAAAELAERVAAQLVGTDSLASQEPIIRTVHSYAYSLLCRINAADGAPPPKLMTGAEKDVIYRELLETIADTDPAEGINYWPEWLQPALTTAGFARVLRDFISRAHERGVSAEDLISMGEEHDQPTWTAIGRFALDYERTMLLRARAGAEGSEAVTPALDAAELVGMVLEGLATHPEILAAEQERLELVLVDDAHHLDPQMAEFIELISTQTQLTVIAGDGDQNVFDFRGADPSFLNNTAPAGSPQRIVLPVSHRLSPLNLPLIQEVGGRLPAVSPQQQALVAGGSHTVEPTVKLATSEAAEAALAADVLRRAHLLEGVPWSDMVIIARSVGRHLPALRRALLAAGVPVRTDTDDLPLAEQYAVDGILSVLAAISMEVDAETVSSLLTGVVGQADPADVRTLRRGLRREEVARGGKRDSGTLLQLLLSPATMAAQQSPEEAADAEVPLEEILEGLTDYERQPLERVRKVVAAAQHSMERGDTAEEVLWAAWHTADLADTWRAASLRGGVEGAQADRNLDAMMALFDAASDFVSRVPTGTVQSFVRYIRDQELPALSRVRSLQHSEAVTLISATSAAGKEWDTVVVVGVQDGEWPNMVVRGSLLQTQEFLDTVAGIDTATVSYRQPQLAAERRSFYTALSRARRQLVITAVDGGIVGDASPSRFITELFPDELPDPVDAPPVLSLPSMVAQLRSIICATEPFAGYTDKQWQKRVRHAREQLARLARIGINGAANWWGIDNVTSSEKLWHTADRDYPVSLSPSVFQQLQECPLRWFLSRHGGDVSSTSYAAQLGTLIHGLVEGEASDISSIQVDAALEELWPLLDIESDWYSQQEKERAQNGLQNYREWAQAENLVTTLDSLEVAIEHTFTSDDLERYGLTEDDLETVGALSVPVKIRGRIDRLEKDSDGRYIIVDFKTGRYPLRKQDVAENPQLAIYQLAIDGKYADSGVGEAKLVYLTPGSAAEKLDVRSQEPLTKEQLAEWRLALQKAATDTQGPEFVACENDHCDYCAVQEACPVKSRSVLSREQWQ